MTAAPAPDRPLQGILLLCVAVLGFVCMDTLAKATIATLPVIQVLWARFAIHLLAVSVALRLAGKRLPPRSSRPLLQVVRSLTLALCNFLFTSALAFIPLAEATSINFIGPLFVLLLAGWWLGEPIGWRRWVAVAAGLAGVVIVLRPGMGVTHPAALLVVACALLFAAYQVMTRLLAGHDDPLTTIWHTGFAATIATSLAVPFFWVAPDLWGALSLLAIGALGGIGHYLLILAYGAAPASLLAPLNYAQLVWASILGFLAFGDVPDLATLLGGAVIAAGGLLSLSEGRKLAGRPS